MPLTDSPSGVTRISTSQPLGVVQAFCPHSQCAEHPSVHMTATRCSTSAPLSSTRLRAAPCTTPVEHLVGLAPVITSAASLFMPSSRVTTAHAAAVQAGHLGSHCCAAQLIAGARHGNGRGCAGAGRNGSDAACCFAGVDPYSLQTFAVIIHIVAVQLCRSRDLYRCGRCSPA